VDARRLTEMAGAVLSDDRRGKNTRHFLTGLLRQSVFGRLAGYEDVNDADRLGGDPANPAVRYRRRRSRVHLGNVGL
jgi:Transposase DDE domain group 1